MGCGRDEVGGKEQKLGEMCRGIALGFGALYLLSIVIAGGWVFRMFCPCREDVVFIRSLIIVAVQSTGHSTKLLL